MMAFWSFRFVHGVCKVYNTSHEYSLVRHVLILCVLQGLQDAVDTLVCIRSKRGAAQASLRRLTDTALLAIPVRTASALLSRMLGFDMDASTASRARIRMISAGVVCMRHALAALTSGSNKSANSASTTCALRTRALQLGPHGWKDCRFVRNNCWTSHNCHVFIEG